MIAFLITVGASLGVALIFGGLFCWATRSGQWDDLKTPAIRPLLEDLDERQSKQSNVEP